MMTNKGYMTAVLGRFNADSALISVILDRQELKADDKVDYRAADLAMYNEISLLIGGVSSVSESGFSMSWDSDALRQWYSLLAKQLGKENVLAENRITDESDLW